MENLFTLSIALEKAVESDIHTEFHYFSIIKRYWKVIIGESLSTRTTPVKLVKKILYILVEDAAYYQHLEYYTDRLMELIASPSVLGEDKVRKIKFRVGEKVKTPEIRTAPKQCLKSLKKNELEMVSQVSGKIKDDDLRAVFSSYMQTIRRRKQ